jgi:hypothetical protein
MPLYDARDNMEPSCQTFTDTGVGPKFIPLAGTRVHFINDKP